MPNKKPIIAYDQDIPYLADWLLPVCELQPYRANELTAQHLQAVDGLIVRSVTPVNAALLSGSSCRWVGSVTAGVNHVDAAFLQQTGIAWDYAPGANAAAVCEYLCSALFLAQQAGQLNAGAKLAVIGVGEVGSRVVEACRQQGFSVRCYDPPRAKRDPSFVSAQWQDLADCEFAIVCAAYTQDGEFPSHQLIRAETLPNWRGVINAARGEIIDYAALFACSQLWTALDVWPNEPAVDPQWVQQATIATPHIAGYSRQSKWNLSESIYQACCDFFQLPKQHLVFEGERPAAVWADTVGLPALSMQMKEALPSPTPPALCGGSKRAKHETASAAVFHQLRRDYPLR